jgi:hypothetical protein
LELPRSFKRLPRARILDAPKRTQTRRKHV